jgi:two-component system KDP operon response regulator KdpE
VSAPKATVLLVEDDADIQAFLRATLVAEGYRVVSSGTGRRAVIDAGSHKPDLAIVDLGLPDFDGIEVIRRIRTWSPMPILVLSARTHERSKVEALDAGADDYLSKPFGVGELLARMRAGLRHAARTAQGPQPLRMGDVRLDLGRRVATRGERDVRLTPIEFRLLAVLARRPDTVLTHGQLLREVWGPSHARDTHYLRVYMQQLREKLEADPSAPRYLRTEIGVGYRLTTDEPVA